MTWLSLLVGLLGLCAVPAGLADEAEPTLHTPRPERWQPSKGRQCRHRGRYRRMCDGPRRTPMPHGPAADLADDLELGTRKAAGRLLSKAPKAAWLEAVRGIREKTLLWPVPSGHFGRGFGYVRKAAHVRHKLHKGIDVSADEGALVRAANDGLVGYSDNGIRGYGNTVLLIHADGTVSLYAHQRANYVFAGQTVQRGQVIGEVGATGLAWGPHLHFEWRRNGRPRDPMRRMVGKPQRGRDRAALLHWM